MSHQVIKHFQKPWQLMVAVCLKRLNLISHELNDIEKKYARLQEEQEFRHSIYNDYEHRKIKLTKLNQNVSETHHDQVSDASRELASIQDEVEMWAADSAHVVLAPVKTKYDDSSDRSSLKRQLNKSLYLVVKDSALLNKETMIYPYGELLPRETLRIASDRILQSHGLTENVLFFSNAPSGCLKIRYKDNEERGKQYQGAKVFVTTAQIRPSPAAPFFSTDTTKTSSKTHPHEWLTLSELQETCDNEYFKRIFRFI